MLTSDYPFKKVLYRDFSYIRHLFRARNTLGYGIHSPYLYNLVHFVLYDNNAYYCYAPIEKERLGLLQTKRSIDVEDFGTKRSGTRRICDIARTSLKNRQEAQLLFRLTNNRRPKCVVELGTCLGITTSYLAKAAGRGKVVTIEGSHALAQEAEKVLHHLGIQNVHQETGDISQRLPAVLQEAGVVDMAFIDANHKKAPTLLYFEQIAGYCTDDSILVIDDIHSSREMAEAWQAIQAHKQVTACLDCFSMGIVFFRPHLMKQTYYLHI